MSNLIRNRWGGSYPKIFRKPCSKWRMPSPLSVKEVLIYDEFGSSRRRGRDLNKSFNDFLDFKNHQNDEFNDRRGKVYSERKNRYRRYPSNNRKVHDMVSRSAEKIRRSYSPLDFSSKKRLFFPDERVDDDILRDEERKRRWINRKRRKIKKDRQEFKRKRKRRRKYDDVESKIKKEVQMDRMYYNLYKKKNEEHEDNKLIENEVYFKEPKNNSLPYWEKHNLDIHKDDEEVEGVEEDENDVEIRKKGDGTWIDDFFVNNEDYPGGTNTMAYTFKKLGDRESKSKNDDNNRSFGDIVDNFMEDTLMSEFVV